ncbi:MAG: type VI secretion system contractile sheath small subunit [Gammaproteobacteria bacterium]|nr:type VI secretion system contractile sheath small subunit [Gammaproteobacteria bacterium]
MAESINDKLKRVRKPRVHITYDVDTNGVVNEKEIPFVMGVMGDYSGDNDQKKPLKDRKFAQVDRDNFNEMIDKIAPQLSMKVDNTLEGDGSTMQVALEFHNMEDFEPHKIVEKIEPLRALLETRNKLRDLLTKADRSEKLENILEQVLSNTKAISALSGELGVDTAADKDKGDK